MALALSCARLERGLRLEWDLRVVARDGIEPPTPAFSGPRSTTELSGLSANLKVQFCARKPASPDKVGESTNTALKNNLRQYSNSHSLRKTGRSRLVQIGGSFRAKCKQIVPASKSSSRT